MADVIGDDRGVSTVVGYALGLVITTILISGLLLAGGSVVSEQREAVTHSELRVIGERVANEIVSVGRLGEIGDGDARASVEVSLPASVVGEAYTIRVTHVTGPHYRVHVASQGGAAEVTVPFVSMAPVDTSGRVQGGGLVVVYDPSTDRVEVRHD